MEGPQAEAEEASLGHSPLVSDANVPTAPRHAQDELDKCRVCVASRVAFRVEPTLGKPGSAEVVASSLHPAPCKDERKSALS